MDQEEAEEGLKSSSLRAVRVTKRGGHTCRAHPRMTDAVYEQFELC